HRGSSASDGDKRNRDLPQAGGGFPGYWTTANRNSVLRAQEGRFRFNFEVKQARIQRRLRAARPTRRGSVRLLRRRIVPKRTSTVIVRAQLPAAACQLD